jgi:hypothetical protein
LTSYEAHTIRKIQPRDSKEKTTWAKSEITKEPLSQEDILRAVKRLNESKRSVQDKKAALMTFQQGQVNRLLDELMTGDPDTNFDWSLAQIDRKEFTNKKGQRETSTITVYVKRAPLKDLNPIGIFNAIERNKQQRLEQMNRPPPPRPEPPPEGNGGGGGAPAAAGIINMGKAKDGHGFSKLPRPKKKYHDDESSVSSGFSSDSDSASEYSSEGNTTISTHSGRHSKKYPNKGRSQSRRREHRKKYYVDDRVLSPDPLRRRESTPYGAQLPRYVPDVPLRAIPTAVPAFDTITAAYQAGKIDADAERFGLDRYPRTSVAEPRAIVSYGRPLERERYEPRFSEPRFSEPRFSEPRYVEEVRYVDDLREEDFLRREERRRRDAEEYIERRASDSPIRSEPRIVYTNPFIPASLPRRYAPSHSSGRDVGW